MVSTTKYQLYVKTAYKEVTSKRWSDQIRSDTGVPRLRNPQSWGMWQGSLECADKSSK